MLLPGSLLPESGELLFPVDFGTLLEVVLAQLRRRLLAASIDGCLRVDRTLLVISKKYSR